MSCYICRENFVEYYEIDKEIFCENCHKNVKNKYILKCKKCLSYGIIKKTKGNTLRIARYIMKSRLGVVEQCTLSAIIISIDVQELSILITNTCPQCT